MNEKTDYVMLPPKSGSAPRKPLKRYAIFGFLLVVVAAASWWIGQSSGTQHPNAEIKQVPPSSEQPSDPQLAGATTVPTAPPEVAPAPGAESPPSPLPALAAEPRGGIVINSEPSGGMLVVTSMDDKSFKLSRPTPATLTDLPAGFYDLTIELPGHKAQQSTFEIVAQRLRELPLIELVQSKGNLKITTNKSAHWELFPKISDEEKENGARPEPVASGAAPVEQRGIQTGTYLLSLAREGWPAFDREVAIAEGMTTEVSRDYAEGELNLASLPEAAEVWIKGARQQAAAKVGVTPLNIKNLPVGPYEVVIKHPEGPSKTFLLEVEPDKVTEGYASWAKMDVKLTSDPPGALVYTGSTRLSGEGNPVTPMTVQLQEGEYDLRAVHTGLKDVRLNLEVAGNRPNAVHFPFEYGTLKVATSPSGADVFLGKVKLGQTPLQIGQFPPGEYQLRLRKERYAVKIIDGRLDAGGRGEINAELNYQPTPEPGEDFTNGVGQRMIWVDAIDGWAEATETPQMAYAAVQKTNPSEMRGETIPVNNVTWNQAVKFCEQLTLAERGQGFVPAGYRYILPTDAQWTVLAAGTPLSQAVTSQGTTRENPAPVGSLQPNALGLYDVRGNVWEWCHDWYTQDVNNREQAENATGKPGQIGLRFKILRGGGWTRSLAGNLEIGYRFLADPSNYQNNETGFRVVLTKSESGS